MKIDFNAPAFGSGSQTIEDTATETASTETSPVIKKIGVEEEGTAASPADGDVDQKVPYSRFSKVYERATNAEREAEEARQRYQDLLEQRQERRQDTIQEVDTSDPLWKAVEKLWGNTPEAKNVYLAELEKQQIMEERAERKAIESVRYQQETESRAVAQNEETIDGRLEGVASMLGRDLTEPEELAILEIVDEYTPKGEDGNYLGDTLPFDKAWEIYELKQGAASASGKKARSVATQATSSQSEGEPSGDSEKNKRWNPSDWSFMRKY